MKINFLKIVLPAIALMLAITASLAFAPAEYDDDSHIKITTADFEINHIICIRKINVSCQIEESEMLCTIIPGPFQGRQLYLQAPPAQSSCVIELYKWVAD